MHNLLKNKEITSNTVTEFPVTYLYNVKKSDFQTFWLSPIMLHSFMS